jgi:hypothetical protein
MKKLFLFSLLSLSILSIALAQQVPLDAKKQNLRAYALKEQQQKMNQNSKKKDLFKESSNLILVESDQPPAIVTPLKQKKKTIL